MSLPHISNVAVALIHMNYPLIGEKRTISDSEGMCLRSVLCMFVCLGCLTIPLHLSRSLFLVWLRACENNAHSCCSSHRHHYVSSPWEGLISVLLPLSFTLIVLKQGHALIHPHSNVFLSHPVSVTPRFASVVFSTRFWLLTVKCVAHRRILNSRIR